MSKRDFWIGVGGVVLGTALLASTRDRVGMMTSDVLGGSWFPRVTLSILIAMGLVLAVANLRSLRAGALAGAGTAEPDEEVPPDVRRLQFVAVWGVIVLVAAYVAAMPGAGFIVATPVFLLASQILVAVTCGQPVRPVPVVGVAIGATAVIYLVFTRVLGQWLPTANWF